MKHLFDDDFINDDFAMKNDDFALSLIEKQNACIQHLKFNNEGRIVHIDLMIKFKKHSARFMLWNDDDLILAYFYFEYKLLTIGEFLNSHDVKGDFKKFLIDNLDRLSVINSNA